MPNPPKVGFIRFGEVAYYFSKGLKEDGLEGILAFHKAAVSPTPHGERIRRRAADAGVRLVPSLEELLRQSELVISAVWGNVALDVAKEAAQCIAPGCLYADLNNSAPSAKTQGAEVMKARGAHFVDVAIFGTPSKSKHKAFICVSGDGAEQFKAVMSQYGMNVEVMPGGAGAATTTKTLAKIYYLGVQALYLELAVSARKAGCDLGVLHPLLLKPILNLAREDEMAFWTVQGGLQAERKAAEVRDYIQAITAWGVEPIMMQATMRRFDLTAAYRLKEHFTSELPPLEKCQAMIELMERIGDERSIGLK